MFQYNVKRYRKHRLLSTFTLPRTPNKLETLCKQTDNIRAIDNETVLIQLFLQLRAETPV